MSLNSKGKIVVFGMLSRHPFAGVAWQTGHYLHGLQRLGYDPYYIECHASNPSMFCTDEDPDGSRGASEFIDGALKQFDLNGKWGFQARHSDFQYYGLSESETNQLYDEAALLINLHGATQPWPEIARTGRLIYLETDPVALQVELYHNEQYTIDFLAPHTAFFTFGELYGREGCKLPVSARFPFKPTRQPVVMGYWQGYGQADADTFTTIGNWKQLWRDIELDGEIYTWSKHHEFMKFLDLPTRTGSNFELALGRYTPADQAMLEGYGWRVRDAIDFGSDIFTYRAYIAGSRGEYTVAKDQNVRLRSGWFSDRSATYLAAGRPVITQDTGFGEIMPTGRGLFAVSNVDEAAAAVEAVNSDYAAHCQAAQDIASQYFDSDVVLRQLLDDVGL